MKITVADFQRWASEREQVELATEYINAQDYLARCRKYGRKVGMRKIEVGIAELGLLEAACKFYGIDINLMMGDDRAVARQRMVTYLVEAIENAARRAVLVRIDETFQ